MTRDEFAKIVAYIGLACGKPLASESLEVYYDLLGDLSPDILSIAAKRISLEHKWPTFPSVAELRQMASETIRGQITEISAAEAWGLAWKAARMIDLEDGYSLDAASRNMPPLVLEAMKSFGIPALCHGTDPVGVVRGQFLKIYEQLAARDRRRALLPAQLTTAIEGRKLPALPAATSHALRGIGEID